MANFSLIEFLGKLKPRDWIAASATFLVAAVGVVQAGIFIMTNNTMRAEQRAWLSPQPLAIPAIFKSGPNAEIKGTTRITMGIANVGKEPAIKINEHYLFATTVPINQFRNRVVIERLILRLMGGRTCNIVSLDQNGRAIFPNTPAAIDVDLSDEDTSLALADAASRNDMAMVAGCLTYETLGWKHYSEVCSALEPLAPKDGGGFKSIKCITYNGAD
jgi:hypothetical protein